jgi:hypothetical protein
MSLLTKEKVVKIYGETTQLGYAKKGRFSATVFLTGDRERLLYRFTPGTRLSEELFETWFGSFPVPELEVDTASVSLYDGKRSQDWTDQKFKKYFQRQLEEMVEYLNGIETGTSSI